MKRKLHLILFLLLLLTLAACKKKEWKGVYTGVEELTVMSSTDTLNSSFSQAVTIGFKGSKCNFNSSTLIWEFSRKEKIKTGYLQDESGIYFNLEFKDDSLNAHFISDDLEYKERVFKGKKN